MRLSLRFDSGFNSEATAKPRVMKMPELVGPRKVRFTEAEVVEFMDVCPGSGLRNRSYWFEFDASGYLIESDVPEHDDGPGATALGGQAQAWLFENQAE